MKKEEAIKLVSDKYPDHKIDKVTENTKYFIISISKNKKIPDDMYVNTVECDDGLKAVDKVTKKIFTYNPILHNR